MPAACCFPACHMHAGIERLIEVNESSSIFVRVDEDNTFLWRALITGPEDTPYSGGCFLFDFFFPANYPAVPPKVCGCGLCGVLRTWAVRLHGEHSCTCACISQHSTAHAVLIVLLAGRPCPCHTAHDSIVFHCVALH